MGEQGRAGWPVTRAVQRFAIVPVQPQTPPCLYLRFANPTPMVLLLGEGRAGLGPREDAAGLRLPAMVERRPRHDGPFPSAALSPTFTFLFCSLPLEFCQAMAERRDVRSEGNCVLCNLIRFPPVRVLRVALYEGVNVARRSG